MPFLPALLALLGFQLAGELTGRLSGLPVPGPVIGLLLLAGWLIFRTRMTGKRPGFADPAAEGLLGTLGLLFVPAGVGVIGQMAVLGTYWAGIGFVLVVSTLVTMLVTVGTFLLVSRLLGTRA